MNWQPDARNFTVKSMELFYSVTMLALKYCVYQRISDIAGISYTDPKGCPRQSILAIMAVLSANNQIVSQLRTS